MIGGVEEIWDEPAPDALDELDELDVIGSAGGSAEQARSGRRRRLRRPRQDHQTDGRRRAPAGAAGDVPRRCRSVGHQDPPGRPGGHRDGQVPGLLGPPGPVRCQDSRRHRHQGAAGPAGREGPAAGRVGLGPAGAARLHGVEGPQQLRLPPTGGRGGVGRGPGRARRPGGAGRRGRPCGRRRAGRQTASRRAGPTTAPRPKVWSRRCAGSSPGRRRRAAATGPT